LTIVFLAFWTFLTILGAARHAGASVIVNSLVVWLRWVQYIVVFCLIVYGVGKKDYLSKIVRTLFFLGLIFAAWGIYETLFPSDFAAQHLRGAVTFTMPFFREHDFFDVIDLRTGFYAGSANYNVAGLFSAMAVVTIIPFLFKSYGAYTIVRSFSLSVAATILSIAGVFVTNSRSAFLSLIAGILVLNLIKTSILRVVLTISLLISGGIFLVFFLPEWGFTRLLLSTVNYLPAAVPIVLAAPVFHEAMGFDGNVFGAAMRFVAVAEAFSVFMRSPLVGVGFFSFSHHSPLGTAENFFAQMLAETGIVGFALLMVFLFQIWQYTKTEFHRESFAHKYQIGFRGAFVAGIVANLAGGFFYDQRIWGLFLVLSAIMIRLAREECVHKMTRKR